MVFLLQMLWMCVLWSIGYYFTCKISEKNHYLLGCIIGCILVLGVFIIDLNI